MADQPVAIGNQPGGRAASWLVDDQLGVALSVVSERRTARAEDDARVVGLRVSSRNDRGRDSTACCTRPLSPPIVGGDVRARRRCAVVSAVSWAMAATRLGAPTFPRERRVPAETLPAAGCVARDGNGQALVMDETHRSAEDTQLAYETAPHGGS